MNRLLTTFFLLLLIEVPAFASRRDENLGVVGTLVKCGVIALGFAGISWLYKKIKGGTTYKEESNDSELNKYIEIGFDATTRTLSDTKSDAFWKNKEAVEAVRKILYFNYKNRVSLDDAGLKLRQIVEHYELEQATKLLVHMANEEQKKNPTVQVPESVKESAKPVQQSVKPEQKSQSLLNSKEDKVLASILRDDFTKKTPSLTSENEEELAELLEQAKALGWKEVEPKNTKPRAGYVKRRKFVRKEQYSDEEVAWLGADASYLEIRNILFFDFEEYEEIKNNEKRLQELYEELVIDSFRFDSEGLTPEQLKVLKEADFREKAKRVCYIHFYSNSPIEITRKVLSKGLAIYQQDKDTSFHYMDEQCKKIVAMSAMLKAEKDKEALKESGEWREDNSDDVNGEDFEAENDSSLNEPDEAEQERRKAVEKVRLEWEAGAEARKKAESERYRRACQEASDRHFEKTGKRVEILLQMDNPIQHYKGQKNWSELTLAQKFIIAFYIFQYRGKGADLSDYVMTTGLKMSQFSAIYDLHDFARERLEKRKLIQRDGGELDSIPMPDIIQILEFYKGTQFSHHIRILLSKCSDEIAYDGKELEKIDYFSVFKKCENLFFNDAQKFCLSKLAKRKNSIPKMADQPPVYEAVSNEADASNLRQENVSVKTAKNNSQSRPFVDPQFQIYQTQVLDHMGLTMDILAKQGKTKKLDETDNQVTIEEIIRMRYHIGTNAKDVGISLGVCLFTGALASYDNKTMMELDDEAEEAYMEHLAKVQGLNGEKIYVDIDNTVYDTSAIDSLPIDVKSTEFRDFAMTALKRTIQGFDIAGLIFPENDNVSKRQLEKIFVGEYFLGENPEVLGTVLPYAFLMDKGFNKYASSLNERVKEKLNEIN